MVCKYGTLRMLHLSSYNQQQLWTFSQLFPERTSYNVFSSFRICSAYNPDLLKQTFEVLFDRHEILRTTYREENGKLWQIIHPRGDVHFTVIDARHLSEEEIRQQAIKLNVIPYDLSKGPMMRSYLFQQDKNTAVLFICMHHIVWDAWSTGSFIEEFDRIYSALKHESIQSLSPLELQYKDLAEWQHYFFQTPEAQRQLEYWQTKLKHLPKEGFSIANKPLTQRQFNGATHGFKIAKPIVTQLNRFLAGVSKENQHATMHMACLAIFNIILHRLTGKNDIVISSPKPGRMRKDARGVRQKTDYSKNIGYFVNPVLIHTEFKDNERFYDYFQRILQTEKQDRINQDYPFIALIEELKVQFPEISFNFLKVKPGAKFSLLPSVFKTNDTPIALADLMIQPFFIGSQQQDLFDLALTAMEIDDELYVSFNYRDDLFTPDIIARMGGHFIQIAETISADPNMKVTDICLVTAAEREQLINDFNTTARNFPLAQTVHGLIDQQYKLTPDHPAVICEGNVLSYQGLFYKSNALAGLLRRQGIKPNDLVAIIAEHSIETIVGVLGTLKSGAAYLPIDPKYPLSRIDYLLKDSQSKIILTQSHLRDTLLALNFQGMIIDLDNETSYQDHQVVLEDINRPDDLIYTIYTSGSTGLPKGAMLTHRNLLNYLFWAIEYYRVYQGTGAPLHSSIAFDLTVTSIFTPLLTGKTVHVLPDGFSGLGEMLAQEPHFSLVKLTPAHLRLLQQQLSPATLAELTCVFVIGGEALYAEDIEFLRRASPKARIVNEYGPTETTVGCCIYEVTAETPMSGPLPIGQPIANTQLYVLDHKLQPLPIDVPGELYIGGESVGAGYLNRPELSHEKFIADPYSQNPKAKLYKTGDLAKWSANGILHYLGRNDHQIKFRGYRIELSEIENAITRSGTVKECVVIVRNDLTDEKQLVAYIVSSHALKNSEDSEQYISTLDTYTKGQLPTYMVPTFWVVLNQLPLTVNGKVDRNALPAPDFSARHNQGPIVSPRTEIEKILAEIWSGLLPGKLQFGIHDNFFQIGGNSITCIQMVARARKAGIYLTAKTVYGSPTIAGLASKLKIDPDKTLIHPSATQMVSQGSVLLTPIQHWFFEQPFSNFHHFNQAQLLTLQKPLNEIILEAALRALVNHHDSLRLRYKKTSSGWVQFYDNTQVDAGHYSPENPICEFIDVSDGPYVNRTSTIETIANAYQAQLNIETGPVFKACVINLGPNQPPRLLLIIHHLMVDGVSWRILLEDLWAAYHSFEHGQPVKLDLKTTSYQDWSIALTDYANSEELLNELPYWLNVVEAKQAVLHSSFVPPVRAEAIISLDENHTRQLLEEANRAYRTQINDILLTALALTLSQWTSNHQVRFTLEGHGREEIIPHIDLTRTVGWFTSIFPVLLNLQGISILSQAIKTVKEQLRAVPHRGIGYGILRYLSSDPRAGTLANVALPNINFNYLGEFGTDKDGDRFSFAEEPSGQLSDPHNYSMKLLDINGWVVNGRLKLFCIYDAKKITADNVAAFLKRYLQQLTMIIEHCTYPKHFGYSPSDFPLAKLDQRSLDNVFTEIPAIANIYPLALRQATVLQFDQTFSPNCFKFHFKGRLDITKFRTAWQHLINHNDVLRTRFAWTGLKQPLQYIIDTSEVKIDWTVLNIADKSPSEGQQIIIAMYNDPPFMQTEHATLVKFNLLQLADEDFVLLWYFHDILLDGWSSMRIIKNMLSVYEALMINKPIEMPYVPPFANYIEWIINYREKNYAQLKAFWCEQLQNFQGSPYFLPHKKSAIKEKAADFPAYPIPFAEDKFIAIETMAKQHAISANIIFQALWSVVIAHLSKSNDTMIGVVVSGRPYELKDAELMVGELINHLPLRVLLRPEQTLTNLCKQINASLTDLLEHSYVAMADLHDWLERPFEQPFFENTISYQNYPVDEQIFSEKAGVRLDNLSLNEPRPRQISLVIIPWRHTMEIYFAKQRVALDDVKRLGRQLLLVAHEVIKKPEITIGDLLKTLIQHDSAMQLAHEGKLAILAETQSVAVKLPDEVSSLRPLKAKL